MEVSWIVNCRSKYSTPIKFIEAIQRIKEGQSKNLISKIRSAKNKNERMFFKQKLPATCFSGVLENRTTLKRGTGLVCLDFDEVNSTSSLIQKLSNSKYILATWISPSGNGVKAIVKIPIVNSKKDYKEYYNAVIDHYWKMGPDRTTSDVNRLCFESYDPNLIFNKNATRFNLRKKITVTETLYSSHKNKIYSEGSVVERLIRWWSKKYDYSSGNRNNSLFVLACSLSNFGVAKLTTEDLFGSFVDKDFGYEEILKIIDSAYKRAEFASKSFD